MKRFNYYLGLMLMLVLVTSCHEEFDQPPLSIPVADAVPNMTIAEFKAKHWKESANYVDTVTEDEVIHGWVTGNDISNNIYRTVYISDGSAGLSISVMQNELYKKYRVGQEIVLPMKGHYVGKATGQLNVAAPYYYVNKNSGDSTLECYNMPQAELESYVQFNQLPDVSKLDTLDVRISDFQNKFDAETLLKYQGLLVRIRDVEFVEADGKAPFADADNSSTNRTIRDVDGNELIVRNSRSADFATQKLPLGRYDVVGIISFYQTNNSTWQFYLRTASDVMGEGKKGTKTLPYAVDDAISLQNSGVAGWVEGYIVGAVGPEVTTVTSNADIEWQAPTTLDNTIVIAGDPNCKDYTKCLIVPLPQGSSFRNDANLKAHPNAYKSYLKVRGEFVTIMGASGLENTGTKSEYLLSVGLTQLHESFEGGLADGWTMVKVEGNKDWFKDSKTDGISVSGYNGTAPFDIWYITPALDVKSARNKEFDFSSRVKSYGGKTTVLEAYLLNSNDLDEATVMVKLDVNFPVAPDTKGTWSAWTHSGTVDLTPWSDGNYYIGFRYVAPKDAGNNYDTWSIMDVNFGMGLAGGRSDFETMRNEGTTTLGTYTSKAGWVANNCTLLDGKDGSNPHFPFIGHALNSTSQYAIAPTMSGSTAKTGTIVSPTLKGGMSRLTFKYGCAYSGTKLAFRVDVKQGGKVVKTWTITDDNVAQKTAYSFNEACPVNGDFTIEFTNLCPSNTTTATKDRLSIWNVHWEPVN